jgi:transcriptional regulatory protein LevR
MEKKIYIREVKMHICCFIEELKEKEEGVEFEKQGVEHVKKLNKIIANLGSFYNEVISCYV